jgi:hypothetical protein
MTAKLNIAQRISAAMADVDYIQKEKKAGMQYTIVLHDAVTAKVRPILHKHGIVYYPKDMVVEQVGNRTQAMFNVRFENIEDRSDFIDVATFGYGVDGQDKGPGKAMSYGVKYALLKVLGLETGDDPDTVQDERADFVSTPMIEDSQRDELQAMIEGYGFNILKVCERFKIASLKEIPADRFETVKNYLNAMFDKKKEKEAA